MDLVHEASGLPFKSVDFATPEVFVGGLMGGIRAGRSTFWASRKRPA